MYVRLRKKVSTFLGKVTDVSVMPCHLNSDVHEGRNEVVTVPNWNPPNNPFWCEGQRVPVGSEDPVKLYCSLWL